MFKVEEGGEAGGEQRCAAIEKVLLAGTLSLQRGVCMAHAKSFNLIESLKILPTHRPKDICDRPC
jgi:hypothetical protein